MSSLGTKDASKLSGGAAGVASFRVRFRGRVLRSGDAARQGLEYGDNSGFGSSSHRLEMQTFRFASFSLDPATRQLVHDGREVSLSPKAFQLLLLLVANRDRAVSKQELQQTLWPSTFVLETNLASLIAEIRRALDDDASKPRFVRTIHRFGYRFVGQVDGAGEVAGGVPAVAKYWLAWELRQIPLTQASNLIGRGTDTAIWIDAPGVSRHHARIVITG